MREVRVIVVLELGEETSGVAMEERNEGLGLKDVLWWWGTLERNRGGTVSSIFKPLLAASADAA